MGELSKLITGPAEPKAPDQPTGLAQQIRGGPSDATRMDLSMKNAESPDTAARILKMQQRTRLPLEVISQNLEMIETEAKSKDFDRDAFARENPIVSKWLGENPQHAALAQDDFNNLGTFEWLLKAPARAFKRGQLQVEAGTLSYQSLYGDLTPEQEARMKEAHEGSMAGGELGAEGFFGRAAVGGAQYLPQFLEQTRRGAETGLTLGMGMGAITAAAGQAGPQVAAPEELITVPAAFFGGLGVGMLSESAMFGFQQEAGHAFLEFKEFKDDQGQPLDPEIARVAAMVAGSMNAALEAVQLKILIKTIPGADKMLGQGPREAIKASLRSPTIRQAMTDMLKEYGGALTKETATEVLQRAVTILSGEVGKASSGQNFQYKAPGEIGEELLEEGAGAVESFFFPLMPGPGVRGGMNVRQAKQAKQQQQYFEALGETAANSKLRERLPEKYQEVIDRLTKEGPVETVYAPVEFFQEYWESKGLDPRQVATEMLGNSEAYDEALQTGAKLAIPTGIYARRIAPTEHNAAFSREMTFSPDALNLRETEEVEKQLGETAEEMDITEPSTDVREDVLGQLQGAGFDPGTAEAYADLYGSTFRALGERTGQDPMALYQRYGLGITRPLPDVLQDVGRTDAVDVMLDRLRTGKLPTDTEIFGQSLTQFLKKQGGLQDQGGELAARDLKKAVRGLVKETGRTLDDAAEVAVQAGYLTERDPNALLAAIDKELGGQAVYAGTPQTTMLDMRTAMEQLQEYLDAANINLEETDNATIKKLLREAGTEGTGQELEQSTQSEAFKKWFGDSKVVDEDGEPLVVYHGTTHDIESFTQDRGNLENDLGIGYYFTTSQDDVSINYAGEGPDLTQRIELLAQRIESEQEIEMDEAREQARKQLSGGSPNVIPAYISLQNPVIFGGENETQLGGIEFDEETGEESGPGVDLFNALEMVATEFDDVDAPKIWDDISDYVMDGIGVSELFAQIKKSEGAAYLTNENGELAVGEYIRRVFEYLDYDGIIDNTVDEKFGSSRKMGKKMEGVYPDTAHIIAFKPEQIKSAIGNRGTFDPADPRILFQDMTGSLEVFLGKQETARQRRRQAAQLTIGMRTQDDKVIAGKPGQMHFNLMQDHPKAAKGAQMGFVDKDGKFYSRAEAAQAFGVSDSKELFQDAPMFYSAVLDAAEAIKQPKGSPDQMLAQIKKTPGVKQEELDWIGLEAWMKEQGKSVTKQEVADFIRANQIEVEETVLGKSDEQANLEAVQDKFVDVFMAQNWDRRQAREAAYEAVRGEFTKAQIKRFTPEQHAVIAEIKEAYEAREAAVQEVGEGPTKFDEYQLPGGEKYRELLLRLPKLGVSGGLKAITLQEADDLITNNEAVEIRRNGQFVGNAISAFGLDKYREDKTVTFHHYVVPDAKDFTSGHFDQPNILAHIRFNERTDAEGKRVLFIEEVQSDWHQKGRKEGYDTGESAKQLDAAQKELSEAEQAYDERIKQIPKKEFAAMKLSEVQALQEAERVAAAKEKVFRLQRTDAVPDAPFKTTWPLLAMKRMIRYAAENGFERIAWTTGEQQAERYDLSKKVDAIQYALYADDEVDVYYIKDGDQNKIGRYALDKLPDVVGKDMADKIAEDVKKGEVNGEYTGNDLKVGGEGMKSFYDKVLPSAINKYVKKWGGKVGIGKVTAANLDISKRPNMDEIAREMFGANFYDITEEQSLVVNEESRKRETEWNKSPVADMEAHSLNITPDMRKAAMAGQPLFQRGPTDKRGSIRFGEDRQFTISLFEKADLSTFLHESGHFYLEVLADLATATDAPTQMQEDFGTLLKWLGVESREQIGTKQHEQFARGFEAYLMEGKAPSADLRMIFAKFRAWLVSIYRQLRKLNVTLNNDVRAVMDRMLATDAEIEAAKTEADTAPMFTTPEQAGMTDIQFEAYRKTIEQANAQATEELEQKLMREYQREQQKWWKEAYATMRKEVADEVNKQPAYIALDFLQKGKLPEGVEIEPFKLDRKSLIDAYGMDFLRRVPRGTYARLDGMNHSIAAEMLGFNSGEELVMALVNARPRNQLIKAETDARMRQTYGDMMLDGSLPAAAQAAVQNQYRGKVLEAELKALQKKARQVKPFLKAKEKEQKQDKRANVLLYRSIVPTMAAARKVAEQRISAKTLRNIQPMHYFYAARKASKAAVEAVQREDYIVAAVNKEKELISMEMYRAAVKAREEVSDSLDKLKKISGPDERLAKTRNMDMVNAARAILASHGIGRTTKQPMEYIEKIKRYDPETYEELRPIVEPALFNPQPYKDMTLALFRDTRDGVLAFWKLSRRTQQIVIDGKVMDRDIVIDELNVVTDEFLNKKTKREEFGRAKTKWEKTQMQLLGAKASLRRVEGWVDAMDGGNPNGVFRRYIHTPVIEAINRYRLAKTGVIEEYLRQVRAVEKTLDNKEILAPELKYKFLGKVELLHAILHTGNESNKSKLLRGYGWGEYLEDGTLDTSRWDRFIARMIREGKITKADYDFAQGIWDLNESLKPQAQKTHHDVYGYYFNEVTATELETPFGKYKGGYIPAIVDGSQVTDAAIRKDKQELMEEGQNSFMFPTTGRGFTKTRTEGYAKPLQLDMRTIPAHLDKVLRFIHIEPAVKDVGRLVINKKFREKLDRLDPSAAKDMLMPWLQRSASQVVTQPGSSPLADRFFKGLRRRTGANLMVLNAVNTLQQFTGLSIAATKVKPRYLRNALWDYLHHPNKSREWITERSDFMKTRVFTQHIEIQNTIDQLLLNPSKYDKVRDFVDAHGYFLQQGTQNVVDNIVWVGAYNQITETGVTEKEAVRYADSVVRQTQGSFAAEDISRFEANTAFVRAFSMFYSYFNMQANLMGTEFANIATNELGLKKGAGRALYLYIFGFMIPAFVGDGLIRALFGGLDDDDDDEYLDDYMAMFFGTQVRTAAAMVPVIGPIAMAGINAWNDKWYDDSITTSPAVSALESTVRAPYSIYKAIVDEGSDKRAVKDVLTALGVLTGWPTAALARPAGYLADVKEGKADPENVLDLTRGLISGRDVNR